MRNAANRQPHVKLLSAALKPAVKKPAVIKKVTITAPQTGGHIDPAVPLIPDIRFYTIGTITILEFFTSQHPFRIRDTVTYGSDNVNLHFRIKNEGSGVGDCVTSVVILHIVILAHVAYYQSAS